MATAISPKGLIPHSHVTRTRETELQYLSSHRKEPINGKMADDSRKMEKKPLLLQVKTDTELLLKSVLSQSK